MKSSWLVTVRRGTTLKDIEKRAPSVASKLETLGEPIPMGDDEDVLEIAGPNNLDRLIKTDSEVRAVDPSSDMKPF
jgi:hypothetical protein